MVRVSPESAHRPALRSALAQSGVQVHAACRSAIGSSLVGSRDLEKRVFMRLAICSNSRKGFHLVSVFIVGLGTGFFIGGPPEPATGGLLLVQIPRNRNHTATRQLWRACLNGV